MHPLLWWKLVESVVIHPSRVPSLPAKFTEFCVLNQATILYDIIATQKRLHCKQDLKYTKINSLSLLSFTQLDKIW